MFELKVSKDELLKALREIEKAEKNGFNYCEAVFRLIEMREYLPSQVVRFDEIFVKAHPTDPAMNWGRGNRVYMECVLNLAEGILTKIETGERIKIR